MSGGADTTELSIIVPVYNVEPWITQCLDSIQRQTFTAWECILVDDGSTDLSGHICNNFARRDRRFRVFHQKNAGVSTARNVGLDAVSAPLLAFIDPDDFISENYFELLIEEMYAIDASIAASFCRLVQEDGSEGRFIEVNRFQRYSGKQFPYKMMDNNAVIDAVCKDVFGCSCWGKIFRRDLWGKTRFPTNIDIGEDVMIVHPVTIRAKRAAYVPNAEYFYRQRDKSLSHGTVTAERLRKNLHASKAMLQSLTEYAPERVADFSLMRMCYDLGCAGSFLSSNSGIAKGKSKLYALMQAISGQDGDSLE